MKHILVSLISILLVTASYAQVGIGRSNPNPKSILDLSNSGSKFLVLPVSNNPPTATSLDSAGAVIYYQGNIYFKAEGTKVKTLSNPFLWDGDSTHSISSPVSAPVGIGVIPAPLTPFKLQIADAAGDVISAGPGNASIVVGNPAAAHLLIDNNELMAKTNSSTAGVLKLQEEGGTVEVRSLASDAGTATVFTSYGSIDAKGKMKENGNDLLPAGSIIMWNNAVIPAGWALCNGGTYTAMDGGTITTPNLQDRFIVGSGGAYALGNTGGANSVALTINEMPTHNHPGTTTSNGAHTHDTQVPNAGEGYVGSYNSSNEVYKWNNTGAVTSTSNGAHTHTITTNDTGGGAAHENRPPYFALYYIMKL